MYQNTASVLSGRWLAFCVSAAFGTWQATKPRMFWGMPRTEASSASFWYWGNKEDCMAL